jgi:adenylate cyclase
MTNDDGAGTVDLREVLIDLGVPEIEVERAIADGTIELLALEKVASLEHPRFDLSEVAALSGLDVEQIRAYWRALGFPDPRPGEKLFTDSDVEMLSAVVSFIADGALEPDLALQMARVVGSAMDKVATAQVDALEVRRDARPSDGRATLAPSARSSAELLSLMPRVMEFVWRRQLSAAARRRMMRATASSGDDGVVVGFADLVGFTAKTQQLEEHELAEVVGRFETVAYDVVSNGGGRVVKMIGDEVMFLHHDVCDGAELALTLAERFGDDVALSDVRVGLAYGAVLERDGDVYGHVVNLANRIVSVAYPGSVVVSQEVHDALEDHGDYYMRSLRSHYLKDIGRVPLWTLRRTAESPDAPYRNARERRAAREFLFERWSELRREARLLSAALPPALRTELAGTGPGDAGPSTGQFEALTDAVLEADLQPEMQVELLADLEAARRLRRLEHEAQQRAAEADEEAERRLEEIEREARQRVEAAEQEARRKVADALEQAEEKSRKVNEEASRKVKRVAEDVEKKADKATKEAKVEAQRQAKRRARQKGDRKKPKPGNPEQDSPGQGSPEQGNTGDG